MEGETGAASVACCWPERSRASSAVCGALMEPIYSRADASSFCGSFRSGFFSQGLDNFGDTIYNHKACKSETLLLQAKPCGRGGMADALDLGSSANRRGSSNLFARTICGSSSVVECHLAKVDVASSNLVYRSTCGCSSMVEFQPSKLATWVRFPSPAPCTFSSVGRAPDS